MNKIYRSLLTLGLAAASVATYAQSYYHLQGTGSTAPFVASVPADYTIIMGTNRQDPSDEINDQVSSAQTIPFSVNFYGNDYTQYKVSDNGYLTFDLTHTTSNPNNTSLPDASAPKNAIFAMWDDLEMEQNSSYLFAILSSTVGSAPNRAHIVKWFQVNHVDRPAELSELYYFAVVFYEQGGFDVIHEGRYKPSSAQEVTESGTIGISNADGSVGYMVEGPNFPFPTNSSSSSTMSDDIVYSFIQGTQKSNDLKLESIDIPTDVALADGAVNIGTLVRNLGTNTVSNYKLNYMVNGGSVVTDSYNSSIVTGARKSNNLQTSWTPTTAGEYEITVFSTNPNGNADEDGTNDTITANVVVHETVFARLPLYEIFTSSTCGPCRPGNENFHSVINGKEDECVYIKFQQDFPGTGDPYAFGESIRRRGYYGVNSIPRMEIDGGWDQNASSFTTGLHNDAMSKFALFDITATYDKWDGSVVANVEVESLVNRDDVSVYVAVLETETKLNAKSNGETEFLNVFKKFLTDEEGYTYDAVKGNKETGMYQFDFLGSYRLPANGQEVNWVDLTKEHTVEDFSNLIVAVWVQDNSTKEVLQAAYATEIKQSVEELDGEIITGVYPNPTSGAAKLRLNLEQASDVTVTLVNAMGQQINEETFSEVASGERTLNLNLSDYKDGVYFVNVKTAYGSTTQRVVVSR